MISISRREFHRCAVSSDIKSMTAEEPTGWEMRRAMDDLRQDVKDGFERLGSEITSMRADISAMRGDYVGKELFDQNKAEVDRRLSNVESSWRRIGPSIVSVLGLIVAIAAVVVTVFHG